jgi:hypothetical protein
MRIQVESRDKVEHYYLLTTTFLISGMLSSSLNIWNVKDRCGKPERGGSEWEPIKILLEGDGYSNKTNTGSNTCLRLTTHDSQVHAATRVLLNLGTNSQPHRPENAAEHQTSSPLTNTGQTRPCWWNLTTSIEWLHTGQAGATYWSDRSQPESPKRPNRPTELQTDPNSK